MGPAFISVVIPTLNAARELPPLLEVLKAQSYLPDEVLIIDSSSDDDTLKTLELFPEAHAIVINRSRFNHGTTRHEALLKTSGKYVCFLTQDALPADTFYIENLIAPLEADDNVAMSSGRQLPKPDARRFEQLIREFNYGPDSHVRDVNDLTRLGIKTFFASDVCSAYRRDAYLACGGFDSVETNEDMLMAARFINSGYKVAYAADACVYHSHNFSPKEQYRRNKAIGRFLVSHKKELLGVSEINEGASLARNVMSQLFAEHRFKEALAFTADCLARVLGNRIGCFRTPKFLNRETV